MKTSMKLVRNTLPLKIRVTGAALRSVESADKAADQYYAQLQAAVEAVNAANGVPEINATNIAEMFRAIKVLTEIYGKRKELVYRHQHFSLEKYYTNSFENAINESACHSDYACKCADWYKNQLTEAGVPMPEAGQSTEQYWRDAAARGC